jgi:hypothetical protein
MVAVEAEASMAAGAVVVPTAVVAEAIGNR